MIGNVLVWILFGALAGWIASMISRKEAETGGIEANDIFLGVLGALLGGLIVQGLAGTVADGLNVASLLVAVFGAALIIGIFKTITPQS